MSDPKVPPELDAILQFLYGSEELDGVWYGSHPEGKPRYWWRSKLREAVKQAFASPPPGIGVSAGKAGSAVAGEDQHG